MVSRADYRHSTVIVRRGAVSSAKARASYSTGGGGGGGGWTPPYTLPSAGNCVAIGTNTASDITPTADGWTSAAWNESLFNSYGGGCFVPYYGAAGCHAHVATGGHNHPDNPGAALFDFEDATWKRLDNANGAPRKTTSPYAYADSELSGSPWWEINGYTEVPGPAHQYGNSVGVGVGANGSVLLCTRAAIGVGANLSDRIHRFDLSTRQWSRFTTSAFQSAYNAEGEATFDATRNRIWYTNPQQHSYQYVEYLDLSDNTTKQASTGGWPPSGISGYCRAILHDGLLLRPNPAAGKLWCFDPDNPTNNWIELTVSGTLPSGVNRWARHSNGKYYWMPNSGGSTLTTLTPPANPKTGTWVVGTETFGGATPAAWYGNGGMTAHYTQLIYVPAIDCLAWIPGGDNPVYLLKPA